MFRHPHTMQERRAAAGLAADAVEMAAEFGFAVRPRRSAKGEALPSEYDDVVPAAHSERNRKKIRPRQRSRHNKPRHRPKIDGGHYGARDSS